MKLLALFLAILPYWLYSFFSEQPSDPAPLAFSPSSGLPGQIVEITEGDLSSVSKFLWDGRPLPDIIVDGNRLLFQVPRDEHPGSHDVSLGSGSSMSYEVTPWGKVNRPRPRIGDITLKEFSISGGSAKGVMMIPVANVDLQCSVAVDKSGYAPAKVITAITTEYFVDRNVATFEYPVIHYGLVEFPFDGRSGGDKLTVRVKQGEAVSPPRTFNLPLLEDLLDSDNDGLYDSWETNGKPVSSYKTLDLAALGCNPLRKDILVEVDWMPDHQLKPEIIDKIKSVFRSAPVLNPDGSRGINVHIDSNIGGGQVITDFETIDFCSLQAVSEGDFYDFKNNPAYFSTDRFGVFHYCIIGRTNPSGSSGRAEVEGDDFYITLDYLMDNYDVTEFQELPDNPIVGTFVHELGHNLGLRHGGPGNAGADRDETDKPNQRSTMNYRYQLEGISADGNVMSDSTGLHTFSEGMLKTIDEVTWKPGRFLYSLCDGPDIDRDPDVVNVNDDTLGGMKVYSGVFNKDYDNVDVLSDYDEWGNLHLPISIGDVTNCFGCSVTWFVSPASGTISSLEVVLEPTSPEGDDNGGGTQCPGAASGQACGITIENISSCTTYRGYAIIDGDTTRKYWYPRDPLAGPVLANDVSRIDTFALVYGVPTTLAMEIAP
jgi:hypothetical protein